MHTAERKGCVRREIATVGAVGRDKKKSVRTSGERLGEVGYSMEPDKFDRAQCLSANVHKHAPQRWDRILQ